MDGSRTEDGRSKKQDTLRRLDEKMREFSKERERLNKMSVERIALGRPFTDGEILHQNEVCSSMSLDIMELQEVLDEIEDDEID